MVDITSLLYPAWKVFEFISKYFRGAELWIDMAPRIEQTNKDALIHIYDVKEDKKIEVKISKKIRKNMKKGDIYYIFANAVCMGVKEQIAKDSRYLIYIHKHEYRKQEQRLTDLIFNKLSELNENFNKEQIKFVDVFPDDEEDIKIKDTIKVIPYTTWG